MAYETMFATLRQPHELERGAVWTTANNESYTSRLWEGLFEAEQHYWHSIRFCFCWQPMDFGVVNSLLFCDTTTN
jgi:hypothetical protein